MIAKTTELGQVDVDANIRKFTLHQRECALELTKRLKHNRFIGKDAPRLCYHADRPVQFSKGEQFGGRLSGKGSRKSINIGHRLSLQRIEDFSLQIRIKPCI